MKKLLLTNFIVFFIFNAVFSQVEMEEINKKNNLIESFPVDSVESLQDLALVKQKVKLRQQAIYAIEKQIDKTNYNITVSIAQQSELQTQLDLVRQEFEKILLLTYTNIDFYSQFGFIFSSDNFTQAFKRFLYLQELGAYRQYQMEMLADYKVQVSTFDSTVFDLRNQQRKLLALKMEQNDKLEEAMRKREYAQHNMQAKKKQFSKALENDKNASNVIQSEVKKRVTLYKTSLQADKPLVFSQFSKQNKSFFGQKGKMASPVQKSVVVSFFGKQKHPFLENVIIKNDGIVYSTPLKASVKVVFEGEVKRVFTISGSKLAVLVSHGSYYTLYANLKTVDVVEGQKLKLGTVLGQVAKKNKYGLLKFQIWKEDQRLDPKNWLASMF